MYELVVHLQSNFGVTDFPTEDAARKTLLLEVGCWDIADVDDFLFVVENFDKLAADVVSFSWTVLIEYVATGADG